MRLGVLATVIISAVSAARLDHNYLPPFGAAFAGGSPGSIGAPFGGGGFGGGYGGGGGGGPFIPIISYSNQPNQGDGSYSFSYATGNGIKAQEAGALKGNVPEGPGEAVHGSYSYTAPNGQQITVTYTADENGFVPQGAHLPTPPPIPPEILKSLQLNAAGGGGGGGGGGAYGGGYGGGAGGGFGGGGGGGYYYHQPGK